MSGPRPNVAYPRAGAEVGFVGGVPTRFYPRLSNVDDVIRGEVRGDLLFAGGEHWVRVYVPGLGDDVLVRLENLRP